MGDVHTHPPVLLVLAAFSRHDEALDWTRQQAIDQWGPLAAESPRFAFEETHYYDSSMGTSLKKTFFAFANRVDPATLPEIKLRTNAWEETYAKLGKHPEPRPLNLDPGYLTLAKLVLASTKDHAHRIYLDQGIFAEVTLYFQDGRWQERPWTFPDYRRPDYHQFFNQLRNMVRRPAGEKPIP